VLGRDPVECRARRIRGARRRFGLRIRKQFGEEQSFRSMNGHRLRIVAQILRGKLLRGSGNGSGDTRRFARRA
jgi:hypothetical protein